MHGVRASLAVLTVLTLLVPVAAALVPTPPVPVPLDGAGTWEQRGSPSGAPTQGIAGSTQVLVASTWGHGAYRSTDNGVTWNEIPGFPVDEARVANDPTDPNVVYVAGYGGLARTDDAGLTWTVTLTDSPVQRIAVHPSGTVAVAAQGPDFSSRIHVSTDQGQTWTQKTSPLGPFTSSYGIAFGASDQHLVVMSIGKTFTSADGGNAWTETASGGWDITTTDDATIWRAAFGPLQYSTDNGNSWNPASGLGVNPTHLAPRPGGGLFARAFDGLHVTGDGSTWTHIGFEEALFATLDVHTDPNDLDAVFVTDESVGIVRIAPDGNGGYALQGRSSGLPPVELRTVAASADGSILLAGGPLGLYASHDDGWTWTHTGAGIGLNGADAAAASHDGNVLFTGGSSMIFQPWTMSSTDGGITWTFNAMDTNDGRTVAFATHPDDALTAWAAVRSDLAVSFIAATTDGGATWTRLFDVPPNPLLGARLNDIAYDAANDLLYAATQHGVYAVEPASGVGTLAALNPSGSSPVAAHAGQVYAEGAIVPIWSGLEGTPLLAPYAASTGDIAGLDADATGLYAINAAGAIEHCTETNGAATCADVSAPNAARAIAVAPGGVWAATQSDGLYVRV